MICLLREPGHRHETVFNICFWYVWRTRDCKVDQIDVVLELDLDEMIKVSDHLGQAERFENLLGIFPQTFSYSVFKGSVQKH